MRCAPYSVRPLVPGSRIFGRVRPARHSGGIDVFLEALERSSPGEVLVVDNGGRLDEACVGDLMALEVKMSGLSGIVIWGLHRDSAELREMDFPIFSLGALPARPRRSSPRDSESLQTARIGEWMVSTNDFVVGDDDGVLFVPGESLEAIGSLATGIRNSERSQTEEMHTGTTLRRHTKFSEFLRERSLKPNLTFQQHLHNISRPKEK